MSLLGIDIGSSGCKATAFSLEGKTLAAERAEYPTFAPRRGYAEIDPELVWRSAKSIVARVAHAVGGDPISAISVSSFGETVVPVDAAGKALANGMLYTDTRGAVEAEELRVRLGDETALRIAGAYVHPMYSICKIMWLKRNMPLLFEDTRYFLPMADFILFKLGAGARTSYSLAARTLAFDVLRKEWSSSVLDAAGVDDAKLGAPAEAGTVIGEISSGVAEELGLPRGIPLVAGGHDQPCAALGAGVLDAGSAVDGLGTTECVTPAFDVPPLRAEMADCGFAIVPHVVAGMYVTYAFSFTSGSVLRWYRDTFGGEYRKKAERNGIDAYDLMIDDAIGASRRAPSADRARELFLLPHFAGAATPYMDTEAVGAFVGLSLETSSIDIIRAILEGITYESMVNLERLDAVGVRVSELRAVGGLAASDAFLALKADMTGRTVVALDVAEAGTLGVAMLAGVASGAFRDLREAAARFIRIKKRYAPDPAATAVYEHRFERYKKLYPMVKEVYGNGRPR